MADLRNLDSKARRFFASCLRDAQEAGAALAAHQEAIDKCRTARDQAVAEAEAELVAMGIDPSKNEVRLTTDGKLEVMPKAAAAAAAEAAPGA